ncbi:MAG: molybdopterin-dependent oxidoreductase [Syntrophales bacterium]|jgi:anaerobic selenocysteine-containing dehydrogenase|nr:molybdopterin-dependent oxidoreductase [Syntrophales bacterium]MDY0044647.1 molybdopterin-dependent oxidoreductase [Syntrophales bacterium]
MKWVKTGCVLCGQNCGLEVMIENGRMTKVRPDKENPKSRGYACRKGMNILYHQYPADRLERPLKRTGKDFIPISWDRAVEEIAEKMRAIVDAFGPRSVAYMGASTQGGHCEGAFGLGLLEALGSKYFYSSAGQEFSGSWWVGGRVLGKQYLVALPDEKNADVMVAWGWNGMQSHQTPRAPVILREFSKNPERLLVVIDPRKSETAEIADIHIAVRPGADSLLLKAMIALILEHEWENKEYLKKHVEGFDKIASWFSGFDTGAAIKVCNVEYDQVLSLCKILTTRRWCIHPDLGIYMGRHSTMNSYLISILMAICGAYCVKGGNVIPGMIAPMGRNSDERDPRTWRTVVTDMPPVAAGSFPPAVMPEEILNDHAERIRAVYVSGCNPLRAYPDTSAYEEAFSRLDLLVVSDIVMNETARCAHYVLPCRSYYESWDTTFFPSPWPEIYMQLRRPIVEPPLECLEASQIYTRIAKKLGLIPAIPDFLIKCAGGDRLKFGAELMKWTAQEPKAFARMPFILAETVGRAWDSAARALIWGMMMTAPAQFQAHAARAGFAPGPDQGDRIFQAMIDNPQGLIVGRADEERPMDDLKTASGKIEIFIPEMEAEIRNLDAATEEKGLRMTRDFPFILNAGRHMSYNANTLMRNPEWNKGKRACTVAIHASDAESLGFCDGQRVRVTTEAGSETGEVEISDQVRPGTVIIPHGFGLIYDGTVYGINVNRLTKNSHRDPLGTPLHRYVPCRLDSVSE